MLAGARNRAPHSSATNATNVTENGRGQAASLVAHTYKMWQSALFWWRSHGMARHATDAQGDRCQNAGALMSLTYHKL